MSRIIQDPPRTQAPQSLSPSVPAVNCLQAPTHAFTELALRARLLGPAASYGLWGWLLPVLTAAIGGVLRFVRLDEPHRLVFDETYYVKDAYSYLLSGYERNWPKDANDSFNAGDPSVILDTPEYVVHPPVGKWMIAGGMALFGTDNGLGWRFAAAFVGTVSILLVALIAQRLFRSPALGALAGLLTAVEGHHLVMSRTSLLDVFLMFWVLAAFGALLLDREQGRRRLAARLARQTGLARQAGQASQAPQAGLPAQDRSHLPGPESLRHGPWLGLRPWRLVAGVCLALAVGTKWSALAFVLAFALLFVLWDLNARRVAGIRNWVRGGLLRDALPSAVVLTPLFIAAYTATWTGWLLSKDAYNRQWAALNPQEGWSWLPDWAVSLAEYHRSAYSFHQGLGSEHPYASNAFTWLVMGRPTVFLREDGSAGAPGCDAGGCITAITSVGNPLIWWAAAVALLVFLFQWAGRRDWRAGAILAGIAAGYLPWFMYPERTTFFFYAISFQPFLILALVYCLGMVLGLPSDPPWRRTQGIALVGVFMVAAVLVAAFFMPVWTAETIPRELWRLHVWMPSWN